MNIELIEQRIKELKIRNLGLIISIIIGIILIIIDLFLITYIIMAIGISCLIAGILGLITINKQLRKWIVMEETLLKKSIEKSVE
jgi:membrane-bound ClpP family serine protease